MKQFKIFSIMVIFFFLCGCNEISTPEVIEKERSETIVNKKINGVKSIKGI